MIVSLLVNALAVIISAYIIPGVRVDGYVTALLVAVVLAVVNTFIKPILTLLTLPLTILTLGLFSFILNALLILLVSRIVDGFTVAGFIPALLFSLVLSISSSVLQSITR